MSLTQLVRTYATCCKLEDKDKDPKDQISWVLYNHQEMVLIHGQPQILKSWEIAGAFRRLFAK